MPNFHKLPNQDCDNVSEEIRNEYHALLEKGILKASGGIYSYPFAIQFYKQAALMRPTFYLAFLLKINVYMNWKKTDLALQEVEHLLTLPSLTPSLKACFEGTRAELQNQFDEAKAKFKLAVELDATNYYATYNYANVLDDTGLKQESLVYFEKAAAIATVSPCFSYNSMGWVYQNLDEFEKAEEYYKKSIEATPSFLAAIYNLATLYTKELPNIEKAKQLYTAALEIDYPDASYELGNLAYQHEDNLKEARNLYKKSIASDPYCNCGPYIMLANVELELVFRMVQKKKRKSTDNMVSKARAAFKWLNQGMQMLLDPDDTSRVIETKKDFIKELKGYNVYTPDLDPCAINMTWSSSRYRYAMMHQLCILLAKANGRIVGSYEYYDNSKRNGNMFFTDVMFE